MSDVFIQQVRIDPNGRLKLRPVPPSTYPHIYRDASSVRWDIDKAELHVVEGIGLDAAAEFRQIVAAVEREYGDRLQLAPSTKYVDVPNELVATITESAG